MLYKGDSINKLWNLFDERKYLETRDLFHDECKVIMESSREVFKNIDLYLQMNCDYPGNWRTVLEKVEILDEGAVSLVHVFSSEEEGEFYATTFYEFKDELIYEMKEYWATVEPQPEWRKKYSEEL